MTPEDVVIRFLLETIAKRARRRRMVILKPFGDVPANSLRLSLGDLNEHVADRLAYHFHGVPGVEVVQGNLLDLDCEAIVSPANSFGDMGGGIDKAIDDFHRGEAQLRVMLAISEQFLGELPVGMGLVVEVPAKRFPFVVAAPTMRIPGSVAGTINAYLAMRAVCVAVLKHNAGSARPIQTLAVPGLGTGVGGLTGDEAAKQMRVAYDNVIGGRWKEIRHPAMAPFAFRAYRVDESSR